MVRIEVADSTVTRSIQRMSSGRNGILKVHGSSLDVWPRCLHVLRIIPGIIIDSDSGSPRPTAERARTRRAKCLGEHTTVASSALPFSRSARITSLLSALKVTPRGAQPRPVSVPALPDPSLHLNNCSRLDCGSLRRSGGDRAIGLL